MRRMILAGALALAVSTVALIAAPVAGATTYNNDTPIVIPTGGNANPYPSSITVSGTAGPITDVNVGLDGLSHASAIHVGIALVAPSGQSLLIQGCAGGFNPTPAAFLTFDDAAAGQLPVMDPLTTGTYKPTSHCGPQPTFPAPGPLQTSANPGPGEGGTATFASTFHGGSAIGTWNLYVIDFLNGNGGSIPGGWSLDVAPNVTPLPAVTPITPTPTPAPTKKCKKKKKKGGGKAAASACKKTPKKKQ